MTAPNFMKMNIHPVFLLTDRLLEPCMEYMCILSMNLVLQTGCNAQSSSALQIQQSQCLEENLLLLNLQMLAEFIKYDSHWFKSCS